MEPTHYTTADGTTIPTPRRLHPVDALTVAGYLSMRVFDTLTDTANMAYAMLLSHRDKVDEATAFLRDGLTELEVLTSRKFLADAMDGALDDAFTEFDELTDMDEDYE